MRRDLNTYTEMSPSTAVTVRSARFFSRTSCRSRWFSLTHLNLRIFINNIQ